MAADIVLHQRGEERHRRAQARRARGKVHLEEILGAGRVGLRAGPCAEGLKPFARLPAHKVVDGVEDRPRVGLDRHPVLGA
jgi:hypothetical protein